MTYVNKSEDIISFEVYDSATGQLTDLDALQDEDWIRDSDLMSMDLSGFAFTEDGGLILTDDCGNFISVDTNRFYPIFTLK